MERRAGTLTFLFTDIEEHTSLWESHPEAMSAALREHDQLIAGAVSKAGGEVVKSAGDGAMAVFANAEQAVGAAVALQGALARHDWPGIGALRVRMGLHTGVAEVRDNDYFGPAVIRAARLCDAAHGGQIVASRAVTELARGFDWINLGAHRLKGLADPVEIHQVVTPALPEQFPALRTLDAMPNTLPRFRTAFFGREDEIAEIGRLLTDHRLVTLTGVGGSGKTRLAVEVAHDRLGDFPDGVFFADLSVVTDGDRVWDAVATGLDLRAAPTPSVGETRRDSALRFLGPRRALLVLDNCEHILDDAATTVEEILDATGDVVVLVTSREGLHVEGERMVQVPSLRIDTDAVRLLRDRAADAGAIDIDDEVAGHLCERLDGLPLAIELVAARCGQLGAAEVTQRLSDRFRLLTGSRRRVARQRTLEATLDWSHDLLDVDEKRVLRRLSVFSGTFSLAAAEAVGATDLDVVASLVDKSLVQPAESGRFRLLETVRAYAEARLAEAGESEDARRALVEWLASQLEAASDEEIVFAAAAPAPFIAAETENLMAAMDWAAGNADWDSVVRLATPVALAAWEQAGETLLPVLHHLRAALDAGITGEARHRALAAHATIGWVSADIRRDIWEEIADGAMRRDDPLAVLSLSMVANGLDAFSRALGDEAGLEQAGVLIDRAREVAVAHGPAVVAIPTYFAGVRALNAGEWSLAAERLEAAIRLSEEGGRPIRAFEWQLLATAKFAAGTPLDRVDRSSFVDGPAAVAATPGLEACFDAVSAPAGPRRAVVLDRRAFDRVPPISASTVVIAVAALAAREGDWPAAARLLAAASAGGGIFSSPPGVALYRLLVPQVREALDKPTRDALRAEGQAIGLSGGLDLAVQWLATDPLD